MSWRDQLKGTISLYKASPVSPSRENVLYCLEHIQALVQKEEAEETAAREVVEKTDEEESKLRHIHPWESLIRTEQNISRWIDELVKKIEGEGGIHRRLSTLEKEAKRLRQKENPPPSPSYEGASAPVGVSIYTTESDKGSFRRGKRIFAGQISSLPQVGCCVRIEEGGFDERVVDVTHSVYDDRVHITLETPGPDDDYEEV